MANVTRRPAPARTETLDDGLAACPTCGAPLIQAYHKTRILVTLTGTLRLLVKVRSCRSTACARAYKAVRPAGEGRWALPRHEFGLDVIAQIGTWRYREHCSVPEMHVRLRSAGVPISARTVTDLLDRYDELVAVAMLDPARVRRVTAAHQQVVLALDGIQPDVGHEVLWVLRDCLSGEVLLARSMLAATEDDRAALLTEVKAALTVPIRGVMSDGQQSIRKAVARVLPGVAHQLCHFHYLNEAATPVFEADRHAKKELNKRVRGMRPLERAVEGKDDAEADVVRGYAVAVRSALSDDGQAPLDTPGLRVQERLSQIAASLERVEKKGVLRLHSNGCRHCSRRPWRRRESCGDRFRPPFAGCMPRRTYWRTLMAPPAKRCSGASGGCFKPWGWSRGGLERFAQG